MLTYIFNSIHYKEVLSRVLHVKESLWSVNDSVTGYNCNHVTFRPTIMSKYIIKLLFISLLFISIDIFPFLAVTWLQL
jgi:hypothetical protein